MALKTKTLLIIIICLLLINMALNFLGTRNALFDNSREADEGIGSKSSRRFGFGTRDDAVGIDFNISNFILDDAKHLFDVSSIVPPDANAVVIYFSVRSSSAGTRAIFFRKAGYTQDEPKQEIIPQVANQFIGTTLTIPLTEGKFEYESQLGASFNTMDVRIIGWFGASNIEI